MILVTCLTMTDATTQEPLDAEHGDRLIGFARTCAVAVRAVSLYPAKHPAVDAALARLVDCVTTITASEALRATVLPHTLLIDGRAPAKADPALAKLATALHLHRISGLTVRNAGDASMWQQLLALVGRPTEEIREAGGIGHLWSESGGITNATYLRSVEVREVDYEQLLRNQALGDPLTLEEMFDRLESGTPEAMGSAAQALLAEIVADAEKLELFGVKLAERCGGRAAHADALTHLLRQAVDVAGGADAGSGSESLRNLAELLTGLDAPTVAFEHHLRVDGTGYPDVRRPSLNLATMLTGIADVYDAMRSQRAYQQAFPSDRILAVMKRNDGKQFDQNLVRRFVQLIGIYPPGTVVRLSTNEIAIVLQVHAPDPHRPRVRILRDSQGRRVPSEPTRHLWKTLEGAEDDVHVTTPLHAADYGVDPLEYL
jgi:hypothetical protein